MFESKKKVQTNVGQLTELWKGAMRNWSWKHKKLGTQGSGVEHINTYNNEFWAWKAGKFKDMT